MSLSAQDLVDAFEESGYPSKEAVVAMLTMAKLTLSAQAKKQAAVAVRTAAQTANSQANSQASALEQSAQQDELALQVLVSQQQTS